ncbi:LAQU0S06e02036g1_1 [Lachancea quebecensis]|uniref:LAQU0S06e02036g1_1 n=1 Tax=Lachancea quebecensis TaxID=1654605 RepID=A0A0P1KSQ4_9SACH|nr:LAQU0S06e02036g1_1 [Lachancea quebecensis]
MVIRHFRRKAPSEESSEESSDSSSDEQSTNVEVPLGAAASSAAAQDSEPTARLPEVAVRLVADPHKPALPEPVTEATGSQDELPTNVAGRSATGTSDHSTSGSSNESSSDSSDDSSSDSDSQDYALPKPVFMKNLRKRADPAANTQDESYRRDAANTRVQQEKARLTRDQQLPRVSASLGSDRELAQAILELDDNDAADPSQEHAAWLQRQEARALRSRQVLEQKQRELEEREAAKLASSLNDADGFTANTATPTAKASTLHSRIVANGSTNDASSLEHLRQRKRTSKAEASSSKAHKKYRPQSLKGADITLPSLEPEQQGGEDNEYSVI